MVEASQMRVRTNDRVEPAFDVRLAQGLVETLKRRPCRHPHWSRARGRSPAWLTDVCVGLAAHANLLLIGEARTVGALLWAVRGDLVTPVVRARPGALTLPLPGHTGTLLLSDVGRLSSDEQAQLLGWLDRARRTQVISTSRQSLLNDVHDGAFLERLYYRLNTVTALVS